MNILMTAVGKRVQLIKNLKKQCRVVGTDAGDTAPAASFVDSFYKVNKYYEEGYIESLLYICKKEKINFILPLYEKEFSLLCQYRKAFYDVGAKLILSHKNIIEICNDKLSTYKFFKENGIKCPETYSLDNLPETVEFPLIVKPQNGMGSSGVFKINNEKELNFFKEYVNEPIIQSFIEGKEYTMDVLCSLNGEIISVVPRERIEVRSGEVTKTRSVRNKKIIEATIDLCKKLNNYGDSKFKLMGPLTIQCIEDSNSDIYFIEINPRFGGGVPLSFEAGIDYGKYFCDMEAGKKIEFVNDNFKEITMLRFDDAIFK